MRIGISLPVRELKDDLHAIKAFAQTAEDLGLTHLRIPEQILRPDSGHLHEPLTLMAYIAAVTEKSSWYRRWSSCRRGRPRCSPSRATEVDVLSGGRLRLGIGVGNSAEEFRAMGVDFHTRGARCDEQMVLLKQLWTQPTVEFEGRWNRISGAGLDPLPVQRPIPMWIGALSDPAARVRERIGRHADGWFVLATPQAFPAIQADIHRAAEAADRDPREIGTEAGRRRGWPAGGRMARSRSRLAAHRTDAPVSAHARRRPRRAGPYRQNARSLRGFTHLSGAHEKTRRRRCHVPGGADLHRATIYFTPRPKAASPSSSTRPMATAHTVGAGAIKLRAISARRMAPPSGSACGCRNPARNLPRSVAAA